MDKWNEELSALHDGEMDELGAMRILRSLDQKPELIDQWELYSLIGESLRHNEPLTHAGVEGARRALAAIQTESVVQAKKPKASRAWMPLALAASLALLAIGLSLQLADPVRSMASAVVDRGSLMLADSRPADPAEMDRYVDLHREVAVPGLQRASFVSGQ
jgi:hypothetical protein